MEPLDIGSLQRAVSGTGAAFRCRRRLQPAGGPGDKVFPPTFAGAVYAIEQRRVPGREGPVRCVLLDSVHAGSPVRPADSKYSGCRRPIPPPSRIRTIPAG
ncbi:MAG: type I-U CRISPR-associated protein Cas7 [Armatimonadota bacterium]|nr:type I-U CRISPR-associated protein Cas7 [Armatimonadota bacterium]MDR7559939.1 type I-U CRISPR-associated protein Cas7 [Armatimonadota bacterium]MDR7587508.1 type I-U CRISPR-associated protein Cas7 [Armatimonadota bacterium]MDR7610909.1 type I-U CRISPR-associated protein Cas7 [Armatimonadota bacterium]